MREIKKVYKNIFPVVWHLKHLWYVCIWPMYITEKGSSRKAYRLEGRGRLLCRDSSDWLWQNRGDSVWLRLSREATGWLRLGREASGWLRLGRKASGWLRLSSETSDWLVGLKLPVEDPGWLELGQRSSFRKSWGLKMEHLMLKCG